MTYTASTVVQLGIPSTTATFYIPFKIAIVVSCVLGFGMHLCVDKTLEQPQATLDSKCRPPSGLTSGKRPHILEILVVAYGRFDWM